MKATDYRSAVMKAGFARTRKEASRLIKSGKIYDYSPSFGAFVKVR